MRTLVSAIAHYPNQVALVLLANHAVLCCQIYVVLLNGNTVAIVAQHKNIAILFHQLELSRDLRKVFAFNLLTNLHVLS